MLRGTCPIFYLTLARTMAGLVFSTGLATLRNLKDQQKKLRPWHFLRPFLWSTNPFFGLITNWLMIDWWLIDWVGEPGNSHGSVSALHTEYIRSYPLYQVYFFSDFSSVRYCTRVHWISHQGTRKTMPFLTGHSVYQKIIKITFL